VHTQHLEQTRLFSARSSMFWCQESNIVNFTMAKTVQSVSYISLCGLTFLCLQFVYGLHFWHILTF